jgi:hypothetical protein
MRKEFCTLLFLLSFAFLSVTLTSEYAQSQDSVVVMSANPVLPSAQVAVDVWVKVSQPVSALSIPLKFTGGDNLGKLTIDSVVMSDWYLRNEANYLVDSINNVEKKVYVTALWLFTDLPPTDTVLYTMHFTTNEYWDSDKSVLIDTTVMVGGTENTTFVFMKMKPDGLDTIPVAFAKGFLGPSWIREIDSEEALLPQAFILGQNYPNPFNPTTVIRFALPMDGRVKIEVFNVLGQKITTLVDEYLTAGYKETGWDGKDSNGMDVASGIYFYRIKTEKFTDVKKMVFLK